ncbi:MAG: response regulator transcription factor [Clostridiales bacterium]|jgi:DNA-binding response OmpR family regulator|nr:response regulator transcription factor [Clostridiales bacterium]
MAKILLADDETLIRRLVSDFLQKNGHTVVEAIDGERALELFRDNPDTGLVILDIMMPKADGWEVCREIRKTSEVPVIMLTARSQEFDELTGFEAGADDYVTKPFSPSVLVKRVEALLRRRSAPVEEKSAVGGDGLVVKTEAHEVYLDGAELELTLKEYNILIKLMSNIGRVYSREQLLDEIWGMDFEGDIRTVDSHVARLRTKLGEWGNLHIKTIYGIGYKIEVNR